MAKKRRKELYITPADIEEAWKHLLEDLRRRYGEKVQGDTIRDS